MLKGSAANLLSSFYALLRFQYNYSITVCNCSCPGFVTVSEYLLLTSLSGDVALQGPYQGKLRSCLANMGTAYCPTHSTNISKVMPEPFSSYQFGWKVEYIRALLSHGATKWVPKETTVSKEESYKQRLHQRSLEGMQDPDTDSIKDRLAIYAALFRPKTHTP